VPAASTGLSWQPVLVILIGGVVGGLANVLATAHDRKDPWEHFWERFAENAVLGVAASLIAFGVSGTASGTIWQQLSTCTIAGIGGGQIVRSYVKTRRIQTDQTIAEELELATKESLRP
jgi:hypothetical protein